MKNYILTVILACISISFQAQTSTGIHHIKYLDINTANSDYSVDFIDEDKVVFATSTAKKVIRNKNIQPFLDLYEGEMNEEGQILNTSRNKGIQTKKIIKTGATFSSDKKTVYFTAKKYTKRKSKKSKISEIYKADISDNGEWINMVKLPFNTGKHTIENPSLNKEGTKMYFSADLPGTLGGKDIFSVDVKSDGTYSEPKNLGDKVNTVKDEITPFIADNNFLYYSSNGKENSLGNFDIYLSEAFENTVSESLHLDSPINSINDDFAYIVKSDKGYFSSNRLQGQDNNDIYSFYIEPDKPVECFQQVLGTVRDKETEKVLEGATITVTNDAGMEIDSLTTDENGNYSYNLGCRGTFTFRATKKDYSIEEHIVNTANYTEAPSLEVNQSLTYNYKEVEDKVVINVNPIYFGFDKWNISKAAAVELDKIVEIMKENTDLIIESASHTDSRGTKSYNQILSERRAKATVAYIVARGIDASRINSKGYGESKLLNNCSDGVRCKIEDHKLNRRTEFVIMNKQTNIYRRKSIDKENGSLVAKKVVPPKNTMIDQVHTEDETPTLENSEAVTTENSIDQTINKPENNVLEEPLGSNSTQPNQSEGSKATELPEGSILNEIDMIKDFKNPVYDEQLDDVKVQDEDVETEIIYTTSITIADNQELNDEINRDQNTVRKKEILNPVIDKSVTDVRKDIPDREKVVSHNVIVPSDQTTNNEKEEAFLNASSSFDQNRDQGSINNDLNHQYETKITQVKDQVTHNSTFSADYSETKSSTLAENHYVPQRSNTNNITANIANLTFEEEEDEDSLAANRFTADLSEKISITDYEKNSTNNAVDKTTLIIKQQQEFKKEYSSNVKDLKKEEVLSINSIDVTPIAITKKGQYLSTNNWRKVDVMRINFQIDNNKYITAGYKEVYILIQNPSGTILNRKGRFKVNNGNELTYTEKTNAYYNNHHLNISMVTDRFIQQITKGIYTITIYIEGYPVGLEMVELT